MNIFTDVQQSGFSTWVRESPSLLGYPTFLFLHTVGLGLLVGTSVALDLRILGFGKATALLPMRKFFSLIAIGFWISLISGVVLWSADAVIWSTDIVFYIKLVFVLLAMLAVHFIRRQVLNNPSAAGDPLSARAKLLALTSLTLWVAAITAGRLTAYIGK
jgi:hypothetical protein